ncbi:MAG TPA: VWA domain-containing protein, partial [Vicinamibacterales bacterium]
MRAASVPLCVVFLLSGVVGIAQQQQPQTPVQSGATFRTTTRLIVQTVSVKDKEGKPIEGLTAKDFTITEDGMPQDIAFVEFQRLVTTPVADAPPQGTPAGPTPIEARPATTATTTAPTAISAPPSGNSIKYQDKRLLVMYFDGSSMGPADGLRAYSNARKYIDNQMSPSDLIAIMAFQNGAVSVKTDFTSDKAKLREVIDILIYGDDANNDGIPDHPEGTAFGQNDAEFNLFNTDRQLAALQTAVQMLKPLPEQKTLLYFTSGLRLTGADNMAQLRATENAAIRANVTLNPIDARGLIAMPPMGDATRSSPGGIGMFTGAIASNQMNQFQRSQDSLYSLAKDTGGKAMFDYNDLSLGIKQAADAMTSYYIIGYYSTHLTNDGKYRRVKVTLNGDLSASADLSFRQGYYGEKEFAKFSAADRERQLEEAFMLDNPITEVTLAVETNFFQLNRAEYFVPVAVKIPGSELALAKRRGAQRSLIDVMVEVKDDNGYTIQNMKDKIDLPISADVEKQLAVSPIQYYTGFTLLPGKYVLKLLARDTNTGRIGTYQGAFTIPNLMREEKRLPISSVVLSSQRIPLTEALLTIQKGAAQTTDPLVFDGQKLFPSVTRVFSKSKDMYVFLQAYQQKATTTQPMVAFVSFFHAGVKVLETEPLQVIDGIDVKSKAVPLRFSIPLDGLDVGRYDCLVTVL